MLGFGLSAVVQALVSHRALARVLGDDGPRSLTLAPLFGIASSSCSYAAVALARSLFRKGASFTAAVAAILVIRFLRTGGPAMLRMMNVPEVEMAQHAHGGEDR